MDTQKQIEKDFKDALRAGDEQRKSTLRMVLSAIKLVEVDKGSSLEEGEVLVILQKEIKSRRESITDAEKAGRSAMISDLEAEISILEGYLPQALSQEEIEALAKEAIAIEGAASMQDMGKVMKVLMPKVQGRADGSQVSKTVRQLLSDQ
ncbi:MAG: GatB/YqeY domain-containing protein [Chloroflexota bacterium]|nr:MAG: GatB/YqeY domain-containing protein [Chloroflexota bacterium]